MGYIQCAITFLVTLESTAWGSLCSLPHGSGVAALVKPSSFHCHGGCVQPRQMQRTALQCSGWQLSPARCAFLGQLPLSLPTLAPLEVQHDVKSSMKSPSRGRHKAKLLPKR